MRIPIILLFLILVSGCITEIDIEEVPETKEISGIKTEVIASDIRVPWAIAFKDDVLYFTERGGPLKAIADGEIKLIHTFDVVQTAESGLHGLAFYKDWIYVYYAYLDKGEMKNKVERYTLKDFILTERKIILDSIPSAPFHDGGRLKVGPDNKLYITTGDATNPSSAQDIDSVAGKILRLNPDGSVPDDNPFGNFVYSYGHRNSQGLAWNSNNELYSTEHGQTRNDEINLIQPGKNYGWPIEQCTDTNKYEPALVCYSGFTVAPAGADFFLGEGLWKDNLFVASLRGTGLRRIKLGETIEDERILSELGRVRDVVYNNEFLYITTSNLDGRGLPRVGDDKIIKIWYE